MSNSLRRCHVAGAAGRAYAIEVSRHQADFVKVFRRVRASGLSEMGTRGVLHKIYRIEGIEAMGAAQLRSRQSSGWPSVGLQSRLEDRIQILLAKAAATPDSPELEEAIEVLPAAL